MPANYKNNTVVSIGNLKESLVYFEYVIPLNIVATTADEQMRTGTAIPINFTLQEAIAAQRNPSLRAHLLLSRISLSPDILPEQLRSNERFLNDLALLNLMMTMAGMFSLDDRELRIRKFASVYGSKVVDFFKKNNLGETPVDISRDFIQTESTSQIAVNLIGLKLVDVTRTSLEHIQEFRKDSEARQRLLRLRTSLYSDYEKKSQPEIEEDIQKRVFDYELAVEKWKLEKTDAVITAIVDAKALSGTFIASLLAKHYGSIDAGIGLALGGLAVQIGKFAIALKKQQFAWKELLQQNPISDISYAREKLST